MPAPIFSNIDANFAYIRSRFYPCSDLTMLQWNYGPQHKLRALSVYFDTLVLDKRTNYFRQTLQDLVPHRVADGSEVTLDMIVRLFRQHMTTEESGTLVDSLEQAVDFILSGCLVIFIDGWDHAICYRTGRFETRQVSEPVTEPVVQGPRESTVENIKKNIGMIRTRIHSSNVKFNFMQTGGEARTTIAFGYMEGIVDPATLDAFLTRLGQLPDGDVLETSFIEDILEERTWTPFPQFRYTERTDVAAASLLNGKIIVLVEGTGSILICPATFFELMQSSEDFYQRTLMSNFIRILRFAAFMIALGLPSLYIAISTFHAELIPTVLLLAVVDSREGIPFPAFAEAIIMVFIFEILREAGIRLPRPVGSAVSIVGALVIGEASINAGIVSPIMVVCIALTGIASFALPQYNLAVSLRLLQLPLMILASTLGIFGLMIGFFLMWIHLISLKSLGVPYLKPLAPWTIGELQNTVYRKPLKTLMKSNRRKGPQLKGKS
ncbi:spore germination protein [Paenibacillus sacheonensis]|uniref:Spore germination protein n=1 Tax=Paenibacillus sacheonensis TaxID=742054 RepID=A0A7X4YVP2_9BACL|nr:spore germination protein [Paenibacillus sacheonensis]MBM7564338.1 spore germination protein KA/spore germination protein [Paenibacillus sacheonensis]NBC73432.1 spore germination protein [Paenibacillus sacheonensis]